MLRSLLRRAGVAVHRAQNSDALVRRARAATELVAVLTAAARDHGRRGAEGVVFSMDRAMQLHALLASYRSCVANPAPLHVLYRASSAAHQRAYDEVLGAFAPILGSVVRQHERATFRPQLEGIVAAVQAPTIFFLVDDDLFVESLDLDRLLTIDTRVAIPSLRLGANLSRSYMLQKPQRRPTLRRWNEDGPGEPDPHPAAGGSAADLLCWQWSSAEYDWAYPLSVDGHLFGTDEVRVLMRHAAYDSPNTFEHGLQEFSDLFSARLGVCYRKSRLLNIPCNKVQSDNANLHGAVHQDDLLRLWERGLRIDPRPLAGVVNESAHQELDLTFAERDRTPPQPARAGC